MQELECIGPSISSCTQLPIKVFLLFSVVLSYATALIGGMDFPDHILVSGDTQEDMVLLVQETSLYQL